MNESTTQFCESSIQRSPENWSDRDYTALYRILRITLTIIPRWENMTWVRWDDFRSQHSQTLTLIISLTQVCYCLCSGENIKLPNGSRDFFSFPIHKDICTLWFLDISLMTMCCSKLYIWEILSVKSSLCTLTPSSFEQYPHNPPSGRSIHQGSVLPRNWTTASHDG